MPLVLAIAAPAFASDGQGLDTGRIESLTGLKGKMNGKEGVFKVSYPRADLHPVAGGVHLTPPLGLTAWAAFTRSGEDTAVMGDWS